MKYTHFLQFICTFFIAANIYGQTPGQVASGLELWLKADAGVVGTSVSSWTDQSSSGNLLVQATTSRQPTLLGTFFNYNPQLEFVSDNLVDVTGSFSSGNPARETFVVTNGMNNTAGTYFWFGPTSAGNTNNIGYAYSNSESCITTSGGGIHASRWNGPHGIPLTDRLIHNFYCPAGGTNDSYEIFGNEKSSIEYFSNTGSHTPSVTGTRINIGSKQSNGGTTNAYMNGVMAEIVYYSSSLSVLDRQKIHTYLAVKYGITLDNSSGATTGDMTATTGVNIWDASLTPLYHNNVIGVGRDDGEALLQKQSHTSDDESRIYLGTLQTQNTLNTSTFTNNVSYIIMGDNQGALCATAAANLEVPNPTILTRIEREWKLNRTNNTQIFNIDLTLNSCSALGSVSASDLRVLIDDDGDFSNGGTSLYENGDGSGVVITYSNPVITIQNISNLMLPNNTTKYLTIGSVNVSTPLPIELVSFDAEPLNDGKVLVSWKTASEMNSLSFLVDKSIDGKIWQRVYELAAQGNSSNIVDYQVVDESPIAGISYYRLTQFDQDGKSETFPIISIKLFEKVGQFKVYPNPTSGIFFFEGNNFDITNVRLYSIDSREIFVKRESGSSIDLGGFKPGVYILEYNGQTFKIVKK